MLGRLESLSPVQKKDVRRAGAVLADAFQHDPVWNAVLVGSQPAGRVYAFETPILYARRYGKVYATSERLEGVAAWLPGAVAEMTLWRLLRSGAIWSGMRMGLRLGRKMEPIFRPIERDRKENMQGTPYIYLQVIGVAPAFQGQGWGGKLLRAVLQDGERAGVPIYLETETERNVHMYERFGFRVINEIVLPVIHLPMWEMRT